MYVADPMLQSAVGCFQTMFVCPRPEAIDCRQPPVHIPLYLAKGNSTPYHSLVQLDNFHLHDAWSSCDVYVKLAKE